MHQLGGLVEGYTKETTASINATNYFKYLMGRYKWTPRGVCMLSLPPPASLQKFINLLHLNQACVQDLISNLTYAQASTL